MRYRFLIITNQPKSIWVNKLKKSIASLGILHVTSEGSLADEIEHHNYDMVLIDSSAVTEVTDLIQIVQRSSSSMPIMVASHARSWRRTRDALRSGASDYILKSLTNEELTSAIINALKSNQQSHARPQDTMPKTTILFADNDPDLLETSKVYLEKAGYSVLIARTPAEAKRKLELGGIDIAILDIRLENDSDEKDQSGLLIAKKIARHTPKVLLTSFPSHGHVLEALRPQFDGSPVAVDFLAREEGLPALLTTIEDILKTAAEVRDGVRPRNRVFVAHGHDVEVLSAVNQYLEKLGLHPIILSEQVDGGDTIIEKFERYSREASFAVALFTGDDLGFPKLNLSISNLRARQNVIFETGYLLAKLGRRRVRVLYQNGVEIPSDVLGFVYIELDDIEKWKVSLWRELKNAGLPVPAKIDSKGIRYG